MVKGAVTATISGPFILSGSLLTYLNTLNLGDTTASGSNLFVIPIGNGQVQVIKTSQEAW